mmetsp:Transcript_40784/g.88830  ORF Transcript_40784/g.88830 Transcript_40784/m.88830 type:complete len:191 (+) Transcript_40784:91-663(+)
MKVINSQEFVKIPKGVTVEVCGRVVKVTGKYGTLERNFRHLPVVIEKFGKKQTALKVEIWFGLSKHLACMRTVCSHIENMFTGVMKKFEYKQRLVYSHFPINVNIVNGGKTVEIRNYLGEKCVRTVIMYPGVTCRKSEQTKDELIIEGVDIDNTSMSAAKIHQSCLCKKKDIRKFLDGIYECESGTVDKE